MDNIPGKNKKIFIVRGMDCASCALVIEKALKKMPELSSANVNYATEKAVVESDAVIDSGKIISKVKDKTGYELVEEISKPMNHSGHDMKGMDGSAGTSAVSSVPNGSPQEMSGEMEGHDHAKMLKEEEIKKLWNKFLGGAVLSLAIVILSLPDYLPAEALAKAGFPL